MITDSACRESIRSALRILRKKILQKTGGSISGEEMENFIEAAVFLKERGYTLAEVADSSQDVMERYELLPEQDREILDGLNFPSVLEKLLREGVTESVMKLIRKSPLFQMELEPEALSPGSLFEETVSRFDTWRENVRLIRQADNITAIMQELLLHGIKAGSDGKISIYDMAMGTGIKLSSAGERAREICPGAQVVCYGQEKDPHKYIRAKAAAMLKGLEYDYANADVIPEDCFVGKTFSFVITGFPVETSWAEYANQVIEEYKAIPFGRFQPGLPAVYNTQILYLLNGISKMGNGGKMAIVMTDDALVDPRVKEMENIRKYVLENDLIETIVRTKQNPKIRKFSSIFLLNKKKPAKRKGKIQIINIENETVEGKDTVLKAYREFQNRVYEEGELTFESRICSTAEYEEMICAKG